MTTRKVRLVSTVGGWIVEPEEFTLDRVSIDYMLSLLLRSDFGECFVTIEQPFLFLTGETAHEIDPEHPFDVMPVLSLLHTDTTKIALSESGHLLIVFAAGASMHVSPNESYEAWNVSTSSGDLVVARPGGGVSFFDSSRSERLG